MRICDECQGPMIKIKKSVDFNIKGEKKTIKHVTLYKCKNCSNEIILDSELKRIEEMLKK